MTTHHTQTTNSNSDHGQSAVHLTAATARTYTRARAHTHTVPEVPVYWDVPLRCTASGSRRFQTTGRLNLKGSKVQYKTNCRRQGRQVPSKRREPRSQPHTGTPQQQAALPDGKAVRTSEQTCQARSRSRSPTTPVTWTPKVTENEPVSVQPRFLSPLTLRKGT